MNEKIAFVCNANCQKRYDSTDEQLANSKEALKDSGYEVRTRGCLSICAEVESLAITPPENSVVNVQLQTPQEIRSTIVGISGDGSVKPTTISRRKVQ